MRRPLFSRPLSLLSGLFDTNRCFDFSSAHVKPRKPALPSAIFEETTAGEPPVKATNMHTMDGSRSPPQPTGSKLRTSKSPPKVIEAPTVAKTSRPPIQATAMAAGVWTHVSFRQAETVPNPMTTSMTRVSSGTKPASRSSALRESSPPNLPSWAQSASLPSLHQGTVMRMKVPPFKAPKPREASPEEHSTWVAPVQGYHGWKPNVSYRTCDSVPQVPKRTAPNYQTRTANGSKCYLPYEYPQRSFDRSLHRCFVSNDYTSNGATRQPQYQVAQRGLPTLSEQKGSETRAYETLRKTSRCGFPTRLQAASPHRTRLHAASPRPFNRPTHSHGLYRVAPPVVPTMVSPAGSTLYRSRSYNMGAVDPSRVASPAGATLYRSRSSHMGSPAHSIGVARYADGSREVPKAVRVIRAPPPNVVRLNEESASHKVEDQVPDGSPSIRTPKRGRLSWFPEGYTDSGSSGAPYTPKRAVIKSCV